jgi:excisionase family DNA binding protein
MKKQFYSTKEVAEILGVSVRTVRAWIVSERLPAIKLNKIYRISKKTLDSFVP